MSEIKLGELVTNPTSRDAIHIAVIPMVASVMLRPGQHVGVIREGVAGPSGRPVGVVDPFLYDVVPKGKTFLLCLYPGSVKSIRHHWTADFFDEPLPVEPSEERAASEAWLREAAAKLDMTYEELIDPACDIVNGYYLKKPGFDFESVWNDELEQNFWKHYTIVTGRWVDDHKKGGIGCCGEE